LQEKSRLISGDWGLGRRGRQIELDSVGLRVTNWIGLRLIEGSITAWFAMVRQAKCPTHKGEKEKKIAPRHPGAE
jgi:hypothetical protein